MNITNKRKTEGFTIIEVVLVLAIAGLIFLIVFLALPALQRSQRDTQRKNDLSRMMSQLTQYQSNHQGSTPSGNGNGATQWGGFVSAYLTNGGQTFSDPSTGSTYNVSQQTGVATLPSNNGDLFVYISATCSGGTLTAVTPTNNRSIAGVVKLEQGGTLCQNN